MRFFKGPIPVEGFWENPGDKLEYLQLSPKRWNSIAIKWPYVSLVGPPEAGHAERVRYGAPLVRILR